MNRENQDYNYMIRMYDNFLENLNFSTYISVSSKNNLTNTFHILDQTLCPKQLSIIPSRESAQSKKTKRLFQSKKKKIIKYTFEFVIITFDGILSTPDNADRMYCTESFCLNQFENCFETTFLFNRFHMLA